MIRSYKQFHRDNNMFDSPLINVLQSSLNYASVQQEALSENIANVNTPGYQRKDASFDSVLAAAENSGDASIFSLADGLTGSSLDRSDPRHIPIAGESSSSPEIQTDTSGAMRLDGNNLDLDVEMGKLAKNEIYYQGLTQMLAGEFAGLKNVIMGGK
jgi:flagellar basal-body rod protein FlgB